MTNPRKTSMVSMNPSATPKSTVTSTLSASCQACSIREMSICSALSDAEISSLEDILTQHTLAPGQALFYQGDEAKYVYNVTGGTIRLSKLLSDGRRQVTGFLLAGDFLGFGNADAYGYTAEAVDQVIMCRFAVKEFQQLFEKFPQLEHRLLARASHELAEAQEQMLLLGRQSPTEKLASFILRLMRKAEDMGEPGNPVHLSMGRSDIADYLGLTIETVSRSFTKLRKDGYLELPDPNTVLIKDPELLRDLTQ
jgi:CRP/FNR family transcriptional regulator